jgi:methionine sulfoxide reductase heme-binding subunit
VHLTSSPVDWYAARAAGIVAYLLLTAVVLVGVGLAGKATVPRLPRFAVTDVHRFGGLLVGSFVALHVATIAIDAFLPFSPAQLAVPFLATYRPLWTGLGIVAAELLLAVAISNRLRTRLPYRAWRRIHYINFVIWIAATIHGIGAGTDSRAPWLLVVYALAIGLVAAIGSIRFAPRLRSLGWRAPAAVGTGVAVLGGVAARAIAPVPRHHRVAPAGLGFRDELVGRISIQPGETEGLVSLAGRGTGGAAVLVRADLLVSSVGATATSLQLEYLPGGQTCLGTVTRTQQAGFDGTCRLPDGSARQVHATWRGVAGTGALTGSITARA